MRYVPTRLVQGVGAAGEEAVVDDCPWDGGGAYAELDLGASHVARHRRSFGSWRSGLDLWG